MSSSAPGRLLWISCVTKKNMVQRRVADDSASCIPQKKRILRAASLESVGIMELMLQKLRCGECWTHIPILYDNK
uniref:Uncharacterized protein n=1 Tax=Heterorhabditis bacteriophora TaxID=37862 RepID=A0A1I7XB50_HETBA